MADPLEQSGIVAGPFEFHVAESFPGRRLVEWTTNLRSRWFQNPMTTRRNSCGGRCSMNSALCGSAIVEDYEFNQGPAKTRSRSRCQSYGRHFGTTVETLQCYPNDTDQQSDDRRVSPWPAPGIPDRKTLSARIGIEHIGRTGPTHQVQSLARFRQRSVSNGENHAPKCCRENTKCNSWSR